MVKTKLATLARLAPSLALLSCAVPKASVVAEPAAPKTEKKEETTVASESAAPGQPDDGIRLPDMLGLPGEGELRSSSPATTGTASESGAVIARPPANPPPKP